MEGNCLRESLAAPLKSGGSHSQPREAALADVRCHSFPSIVLVVVFQEVT